MTNPTAAMRMLITYAVCIPVALVVGYLLTNPLDYGMLGFLGLLIAVLVSPIFIRWYYPLLVFALNAPIICFFLPGKPTFTQVVIIITLVIIVTERILSGEKRSVSVPVMTWPLMFIMAVTYMTAELNGGISLHALSGDTGGGRKYIDIFIGCGVFFALSSQTIPRNKRTLYLILYMLPGLLGMIGNLFPFLPSPLNKINLLIPPTSLYEDGISIGTTRLTEFSFAIGTVMYYMLARYGLGGILSGRHPFRGLIFGSAFFMSMLGGFRSSLGGMAMLLVLMFFFEGLHRTRLLPAILLCGVLAVTVLATCSDKLPYTFQRSMSFLPLKWDSEVLVDANGTAEWRFAMWRVLWPQVPNYLLLGKGYTITKEDYEMMGQGQFANLGGANIDPSQQGLALSGDYHSGPLSALLTFGLWGGIAILWLMGATFYVLYCNYKYGDPELRILNIYLFASCIGSIIGYMFIFGSYKDSMAGYGGMAAFSLAMNGGLGKRPARAASNPRIKPLPQRVPQPA